MSDPILRPSESALPKTSYAPEKFWLLALVLIVAVFAVSLPLPSLGALGRFLSKTS